MVIKKYLCAAPRPETWKEKAEALLQALGGDETRREEIVRQTLASLRKLHGKEKRTGPGRRSNAEHAIEFYEYILGHHASGEEDDDQDYDKNGEESDSITSEKEEETTDDEGETTDGDKSESSASTTESKSQTLESMDTQEFLNQHNDECEVCNMPGQLLCCSTCSLVFHMDCLRPTWTSVPKEHDEWSCPYCIMQGVKGFKRHSKAWKAAAAAVRYMGRLRSQKRQHDVENDSHAEKEDGQQSADDAATNESHPDGTAKDLNDKAEVERHDKKSQSAIEKNADESSIRRQETTAAPKTERNGGGDTEKEPSVGETKKSAATITGEKEESSATPTTPLRASKKWNRALYKLVDTFSGSPDPAEDLVVHGRRPRRQPSLYQPQDCADSRWQSDERKLEKPKESEDDNDGPDHKGQAKGAQRDVGKGRHNSDNKDSGTATATSTIGTANPTPERTNAKDADEYIEKQDPAITACAFCADDPSIFVCVFCACRVCYGKHEQEKVLKCAKCNDKYHSFCLGLKTIPAGKKWHCPGCDKTSDEKVSTRASTSTFATHRTPKSNSDSKNDASVASSSRSSPSKQSKKATKAPTERKSTPLSSGQRQRGRPPMTKGLLSTPSPLRKRGRPPKSTSSTDSGPPKKRGRPPKSASLSPSSSKHGHPVKAGTDKKRKAEAAAISSFTSPPRKRGRPPKHAAVAEFGSPSSDAKKRGPGRPPNSSRGPGRPPKSDISFSSSAATSVAPEVEPPEPSEPVKVSRSGRVVKRQSFHDEIYEGEQHLRSAKLQGSDLIPQEILPPVKNQQQSVAIRSKSNESAEQRKSLINENDQEESEVVVIPSEATALEELEVKASPKEDDKEEENFAPVRMKPVVQPPAPTMRQIIVEANQAPVAPGEETDANFAIEISDVNLSASKTPTVAETLPCASVLPKQPDQNTPKIVPPSHPEPPSAAVVTARPTKPSSYPSTPLLDLKKLEAAVKALPDEPEEEKVGPTKVPRRKPGARECMQISRRFGVKLIPEKYMNVLLDYCSRGKVEHLIRMRERLDCHSRYLESQIAGLESLVREHGETDVIVPPLPEIMDPTKQRFTGGAYSDGSVTDEGANVMYSSRPYASSSVPRAPYVPGNSVAMPATSISPASSIPVSGPQTQASSNGAPAVEPVKNHMFHPEQRV